MEIAGAVRSPGTPLTKVAAGDIVDHRHSGAGSDLQPLLVRGLGLGHRLGFRQGTQAYVEFRLSEHLHESVLSAERTLWSNRS